MFFNGYCIDLERFESKKESNKYLLISGFQKYLFQGLQRNAFWKPLST